MAVSENNADLFVVGCLNGIGCIQYSSIFCENEIDFGAFKELTREELSALLPGKVGPQKKIFGEIQRIKAIDAGSSEVVRRTSSAAQSSSPVSSGEVVTTKSMPRSNAVPTETGSVKKPDLPSAIPNRATSEAGSLRKPAGPPKAIPVTEEQKSGLAKYGIVLPTAGQFATSIAVGTAQKIVIDEYIYPLLPGKSKPAGGAATTEKPGTEKPVSDTATNPGKPEASTAPGDTKPISDSQGSTAEGSAVQDGSTPAVNARMSPGDGTTGADSGMSANTVEPSNPFQEMYGGPENNPIDLMQSDGTYLAADNLTTDTEYIGNPEAYGEYDTGLANDGFYDAAEVPVDIPLDVPVDVPVDVPLDVPVDVVDVEVVTNVVDGVVNALFGV